MSSGLFLAQDGVSKSVSAEQDGHSGLPIIVPIMVALESGMNHRDIIESYKFEIASSQSILSTKRCHAAVNRKDPPHHGDRPQAG